MSDEPHLKPCPLGHTRDPRVKAHENFVGNGWHARVSCWWDDCYEGPTREGETKEDAIRLATEAWNTRPATVPEGGMNSQIIGAPDWTAEYHAGKDEVHLYGRDGLYAAAINACEIDWEMVELGDLYPVAARLPYDDAVAIYQALGQALFPEKRSTPKTEERS